MDQQTHNEGIGRRVTAVVPAYNEAPRIGAVLDVLSAYPGFREVIVVDDGSTDGTAEVAARYNVRLVKNGTNMGKGYSMDCGVALAETDIIFFSDADITGLTPEIIEEIVAPVLEGSIDMFIGMCSRRWYIVHEMLTFIPLLGGERAVTKALWHRLPEYYREHFRIEVALNFFAIYHGQGFRYKVLPGVTQTVKEEKYGFWEGVKARLQMFYNIFSAQLRLHFRHLPERAKNGRWLALLALYGAAGTIASVLIFMAVYFGPSEFVRFIFAEDLYDPTATIAPVLLQLADFTPVDTIALVGLLIFVSSISIFILTWKNLDYLWYSFLHKARNGVKETKA